MNGNSEWFYGNSGNIGFGLDLSYNEFIIHSVNANNRFKLSMFEGDGSGFSSGLGFLNYDWGSDYDNNYKYRQGGFSLGLDLNFWWQKSSTTFIK